LDNLEIELALVCFPRSDIYIYGLYFILFNKRSRYLYGSMTYSIVRLVEREGFAATVVLFGLHDRQSPCFVDC
jgi:hypothetical protein